MTGGSELVELASAAAARELANGTVSAAASDAKGASSSATALGGGRWRGGEGGTDVESSMRTISIDDARIFAIT